MKSASFRDRAIVLRRWEYSETSQVASLLTATEGKRRVMAKGARRARAKKQGPRGLDLFATVQVTIYPKRGDSLDLLGEWQTIDFRGPIRRRLPRLLSALLLAELADGLCPLDQPVPEAYQILSEGLGLVAKSPTWVGPFYAAAFQLLSTAGFLASIEQCVSCQKPSHHRHSRPWIFEPGQGGLLCPACRAGGDRFVELTPGSLRLLANLGPEGQFPIDRLRFDRAQAREIWRALRLLIREVMERKLRLETEIDRLLSPQVGFGP